MFDICMYLFMGLILFVVGASLLAGVLNGILFIVGILNGTIKPPTLEDKLEKKGYIIDRKEDLK